MKRYNGRELNENDAVISLLRKGCRINTKEIDISKARNIGNGSFGVIDFLTKFKGYYLKGGYNAKNNK